MNFFARSLTAAGPFIVAGALCAIFALRFVIEYVFLLPSPVADPAYFITASVNYCGSQYLGTTVYPIDPTGQSRMIWHGFVSPMLFGALNPTCAARNYYLILWAIKASTAALIVLLGRQRRYAVLRTLGLSLFALAAQTAIGFRPETLVLFLLVLAELAIDRQRYFLIGAVLGALICTQPTVAGLYGLALVLLRPELIRRWSSIGLACSVMVVVLTYLYPFPVLDLINGIRLQAQRLIHRSDGSVISYYLLNPALPGWGLLMLGGVWVNLRHKRLLLLVPPLWFFGPRVPPVYYNLVPICWVLCVAAFDASRKVANAIGVAALLVGTLGLGLMSARDVLTMYRYGDTFRTTRAQVAQLSAQGADFATAVPFLALTNPDMRFTDPTLKSATATSGRRAIDTFAVNGMPSSPCPDDDGTALQVSLGIGNLMLFGSNSGWMIYVCRQKT